MVNYYPEFETVGTPDPIELFFPRRQKEVSRQSNIASVMSLTALDGSPNNPAWEALSNQWTIESFSYTNDSRIITKPTYGRRGFFSQGLGVNASVITLGLQYSPRGPVGLRFSSTRQRWFETLADLRKLRAKEFYLRIGGVVYGIWILRSCPFDMQHNVKIPSERTEGLVFIAPRVVRVPLTFIAVSEDFYTDSELSEESIGGI